ncbi:unnamed protein product [Thelazia callipaeda]|uniref:Transcription termination factor 2 n=1 Tax=Thelazia callipaeda TaxID=103827 RepID=A0A0N5DAX8_THECL|nr:unnamed protein product [Thelazia callipaeda]
MRNTELSKLPDGGQRLLQKIKELEKKLNDHSIRTSDENLASYETIKKNEANIIPIQKGPLLVSPQIPRGYRLFGGKMTDDRFFLANAVTGQVIARMHNSLSNIPENVKTDTPTGVQTELMPHQKEGLTWLLWRENQLPPGGILADDMGLGKTLSMISLIVHAKERHEQDAEQIEKVQKKNMRDRSLIPSKSTLVIAPASVIFQWEQEFKKHVKKNVLSCYVFHGPKQKRIIDPMSLAVYDVVITTYGIVSSELAEKFTISNDGQSNESNGSEEEKVTNRKISRKSNSALLKIFWERIILDEAHQIKNRASRVSKACCKIPARARWCLTGTPIHNNLWDLYSLIRFLRVTPFDEEAVWKEYILSTNSSSQRLNTLVKGLLLRREKNQLRAETNEPIVNLMPKICETIELKLEGFEKKVYDYMFQASRQQVKELIKSREDKEEALYGIKHNEQLSTNTKKLRNPFLGGSKTIGTTHNFQTMTCVLTLLMRLRQACVHFALINQAVDMEALETLGVDEDENDEMLSKCFSNMSFLDEKAITMDPFVEQGNNQLQRLFEKTFLSTKIKKLLEHLDYALSSGDKCVVVSQWTSLLSIIEYHLERKCISYTSITGKVLVNDRQIRADSFNTASRGPQVMLLSLTAGGVGLNLVGGNHLFLIDLHWNPALEQQASDRIHRMGQLKNVYIHKFVCLDTIEERVLALQQVKQTLAKSVLEGAASKKLNNLTVADLKYLFDLGRQPNEWAAVPSSTEPPKIVVASATSSAMKES